MPVKAPFFSIRQNLTFIQAFLNSKAIVPSDFKSHLYSFQENEMWDIMERYNYWQYSCAARNHHQGVSCFRNWIHLLTSPEVLFFPSWKIQQLSVLSHFSFKNKNVFLLIRARGNELHIFKNYILVSFSLKNSNSLMWNFQHTVIYQYNFTKTLSSDNPLLKLLGKLKDGIN